MPGSAEQIGETVLQHQGTVYPATAAAAPFLCQLAQLDDPYPADLALSFSEMSARRWPQGAEESTWLTRA